MNHTESRTRRFTQNLTLRIAKTLHNSTLVAALFVAIILASPVAYAQQDDPPRRPQGPAASPIIKLPRGAGAETQPTEHERPERGAAAQPRKWEYCAITGFVLRERSNTISISAPRTPWAIIRYFPNNREEIEGTNEEDALANAFAKLGDDGWEMTGVRSSLLLNDGSGETRHVYYFKRPRRDE